MKIFLHAMNTWLLAQLLHPFLFMIYYVVVSGQGINIGEGGFFILFLILSVVFSIPVFLVLCPLLYLISNGPFSVNDKLFLWIVAILALFFVSFSFFLFLSDGGLKWEDLELMIPAALSALVSIFIRRNAFINIQMINSTNKV